MQLLMILLIFPESISKSLQTPIKFKQQGRAVGSIITPVSQKELKDQMDFGNVKIWTWSKARTTTIEKTGWLKALQLLIATILHLNHKIILPG